MPSFDVLIKSSEQLWNLEYFSVALLVLLICEWIQMFPQEVLNVWIKRNWSAINIIYVVDRYAPFLLNVFLLLASHKDGFCVSGFHIATWISIIGLIAAELGFILRAYALWGASRPVAIFLSFLTTGMITASVAIPLVMESVRIVPNTTLSVLSKGFLFSHSCLPDDQTGGAFVMWGCIVMLATDAIVTSMVVWTKFRIYNVQTNQLLNNVCRDSCAYFLLHCVITAAAIFAYLKAPGPIIEMSGRRFGASLSSVLSCRMILWLKGQGSRNLSWDQNMLRSASLPTIQFQRTPQTRSSDDQRV